MSSSDDFRNCKFNFQPEGRKIKIKIKIIEGKLFINGKPFLHQFTFKNYRKIFINDEKHNEYFLYESTITNFLNKLLKDKIITIKNSRLILVD
jgi:hypothetical protein